LSIFAGEQQHLAIKICNLSLDSLACLDQRHDRGSKCRPLIDKLRGAHGKYVHLCSANNEPEVLEQPADLVLKISLDLDE
jgi:hypothetical protein